MNDNMVEWKTIGSLIERKRIKAKTLQEASPVYAVTNTEGFVLSSSLHDFTIHSEDTSNYMVVGKNDFAYNPSRLNIGSISYFSEEGYGLISPMYVVFHADESIVTPEYLYTVIKSEGVRNKIDALKEVGARFRFDFSRWDLIQIPIPSLDEQKRIVGILDTFTDSIENLKQQIAQRRKQFEFYRNQLLDNVSITEKIGKLTKVFSCPRVYKDQWKDSGIPFWRSSDVMSYHNRVKNPRGEVYISQSLFEELLQKSEKIEKGDILVTGGGSIGIPYLKKDNNPLFVKDADLICIKKCEGIIPSFLYHFFFSTSFRLYLKKITHDATIAHYTISQILETPIPLPPLPEQSRIVSILDTFEASITNLEAQLAQRQKQYEYYRNKLLTFE